MLGDTIAIMARGTLRALGSSVRLKQRYGNGYQARPLCHCKGQNAPAAAALHLSCPPASLSACLANKRTCPIQN